MYADDVLRANCVYDSTSRTEVTVGGDETTNEMCINFLAYYPEGRTQAVFEEAESRAPPCAGQHKCCDAVNGTVCEEICDSGGSGLAWLFAHAAVMFVAWGIMIPVGVACSALRDRLDPAGKGKWFKWHRGLQSAGLVLSTAGAVVAIASVGSHADTLHKVVGASLSLHSGGCSL